MAGDANRTVRLAFDENLNPLSRVETNNQFVIREIKPLQIISDLFGGQSELVTTLLKDYIINKHIL